MPFFRKKRQSIPTATSTATSSTTTAGEKENIINNNTTRATNNQIRITNIDPQNNVNSFTPPLHNFKPPEDYYHENSYLTTRPRLNNNSIDHLPIWAKNYFSAFLKNEGFEDDLVMLLDELNEYVRQSNRNEKINCEKENKSAGSEDQELRTNNNIDPCIEEKEKGKGKGENDNDVHAGQLKLRAQTVLLKSLLKKSSSSDENIDNDNNDSDKLESFSSISKLQSHLHQVLQDVHLPRYLESKYHIKCQVDFFTNGQITLHEILSNQLAIFYFMEFVDQECKREVLEFWLGATNFSEQFQKTDLLQEVKIDLKTAQSDAMVLYEKYISLQASHPLGFRDEIRSDVERLICSQDEIANCFDKAILESFIFLHMTCLDGFLKSSLFFSFLSDLINSLGSSASNKTHKRSESTSTCSSSSVSLTSPKAHLKKTSQHNRHKSGLSFGRVNSLGKFEADTDIELVNKPESSLAKTMKKLVNFDEKEKAWQVAAMIVNEITSITMGTGDSNSFNQ